MTTNFLVNHYMTKANNVVKDGNCIYQLQQVLNFASKTSEPKWRWVYEQVISKWLVFPEEGLCHVTGSR